MKKLSNLSIRKKLFGVILIILAANFVLLVVLGSTLFQSFYESNKVRELKKDITALTNRYQENTQQSWDELYDQIFTAENRNSVVTIFEYGDGIAPKILYHSRMRIPMAALTVVPSAGISDLGTPAKETTRAFTIRSAEPPPFTPTISTELLAALEAAPANQVSVSQPTPSGGHGKEGITLLAQLDEGLYVQMETPTEYIAETADLAVQYSAFVSIGVLLAGALGIYYLSGRFTRPIREMDAVAQRIAELDFSATCTVKGGDELGALGASINHMSAELRGNTQRLEEANQVLKDDLARQQETDRIRRQFISDVSHDFKTPLTLMVSYAEAIREQKDPTRTEEFCDIIADEGNRLARMVGRLLKLSRLESGMETLERSVWSLNQLLEDTIRTQSLPLAEKKITLRRDFCDEVIVEADYQKLEQVMANLMENAVKYSPTGGSIVLSTTLDLEGRCKIGFWNEGPALADAELENIFVSFYRADKARERQNQSYGLGLAIVQTILELHGEKCVAENCENGVLFHFSLPVAVLPEDVM